MRYADPTFWNTVLYFNNMWIMSSLYNSPPLFFNNLWRVLSLPLNNWIIFHSSTLVISFFSFRCMIFVPLFHKLRVFLKLFDKFTPQGVKQQNSGMWAGASPQGRHRWNREIVGHPLERLRRTSPVSPLSALRAPKAHQHVCVSGCPHGKEA